MSMRILMTLDAVGGVWRYAMDLAAGLAEAGNQVIFAGFGPLPSSTQSEEAKALGPLEWSETPLDWLAEGPAELVGANTWLRDRAARHRVDVLHLNQPSLAAGLNGETPRVVVSHSCLATWFSAVDDTGVPKDLYWQYDLTLSGLRNADCIVAPSAAHAAATAASYRVTNIVTIPNASRSPLGRPTAGDGRVVAAARWWDRGKNGRVLDRAAGLCDTPLKLIGPGTGPDAQRFDPNHVGAPVALPHPETLDTIAAASLFVSPSLYEPFGLAALEAARAARPLLLSDISVYRELWDGAARFFDPRDPDDLARAIRALMRSPDDRMALGAAAQRRALRYQLSDQVAGILDVYKGATASAPLSMMP